MILELSDRDVDFIMFSLQRQQHEIQTIISDVLRQANLPRNQPPAPGIDPPAPVPVDGEGSHID